MMTTEMMPSKKVVAVVLFILSNVIPCAFPQHVDDASSLLPDPSRSDDFKSRLRRATFPQWNTDERHRVTNPSLRRSLQTPTTVCNTILASWTPQQVSSNFFNALGNTPITPLLQILLQSKFVYGVQIRTVCATCRQIMARLNATSKASLNGICGPKAYGENTVVSGLAMFPLVANTTLLASGTMKGVVYCHGTRTDSWPSSDFKGSNTAVEILQYAALTSLGGTVVVIPDYMGFGSSSGRISKAYTVLKSYQTSFIPVWYQAQYLLARSTNCSAVLGNQAAVVGYSEGGYAAIAVSQVLAKVGVQILHVDAGGAPFRVASSAILSIVQGVDSRTFPLEERFIFALIGSAYSGTYPLPNTNYSSQYILKASVRDKIVALVRNSSSTASLFAQIPTNDPLSVYSKLYVTFARQVIASGNRNPCSNNTAQFRKTMGNLCDALVMNDLTSYLETQVNYPVRLCHSQQDALVAYANLPNITRNSKYLSLLPGATGTHQDASIFCVAQAFLYLIGSDFQNVIAPKKARFTGC